MIVRVICILWLNVLVQSGVFAADIISEVKDIFSN